ncbi:MAG: hypothetical protein ACXACU_07165 [Candidatus Hodarchaeales archaeon]|jgi:hypothetical protein
MVLDLILPIFVNLKALTLIVGGLLAASWLVVRIAGVSSEDISGMVDKIAILGFPVGIIAFLTIGAGIFLISNSSTSDYPTFDILTVVCLGILGIVLILRPIKDFRFGTIISLAIGLLGAGLLVFLGAESIKLLSVFFIILFFTIFGAIKIFEDLYLLIAEILSSPFVSVIIGVLCIIQGTLLIFNVSLWGILTQVLQI